MVAQYHDRTAAELKLRRDKGENIPAPVEHLLEVAGSLAGFAFSRSRILGMNMTDEQLMRLKAHRNNIHRYRRLLTGNLTEHERQFVERRLTEEQSATHDILEKRG